MPQTIIYPAKNLMYADIQTELGGTRANFGLLAKINNLSGESMQVIWEHKNLFKYFVMFNLSEVDRLFSLNPQNMREFFTKVQNNCTGSAEPHISSLLMHQQLSEPPVAVVSSSRLSPRIHNNPNAASVVHTHPPSHPVNTHMHGHPPQAPTRVYPNPFTHFTHPDAHTRCRVNSHVNPHSGGSQNTFG